jgi:hypothetical protein
VVRQRIFASRSVAVLTSVVLVAIGCQSAPPPSPTPFPTPSVVVTEPPPDESLLTTELAHGCWGIREPDCGRAVGAAFDALAEFETHSYGYATVEFSECPESSCPEGFIPGVIVRVLLEPTDGSAPIEALVRSEAIGLVAEAQEAGAYIGVEPRSGPANLDEPFAFTLGHCGIWSGIDAGGSFWDPIGLIDRENPDTINSAAGIMVISSEESATLQTPRLRLELVRHQGPKYLPACA